MKKTIYSDDYALYIETLVKLRKKAGYTQRQLSKKLKWDQSAVARVEMLERRIDICEFIFWCETLRTDPIDVLTRVYTEVKHRR